MDIEIKQKLAEQDAKLDAIYVSVEKTRKYFAWIFWVTIIAFIIPLIGLVFAIPSFLSNYAGALNGVGL